MLVAQEQQRFTSAAVVSGLHANLQESVLVQDTLPAVAAAM